MVLTETSTTQGTAQDQRSHKTTGGASSGWSAPAFGERNDGGGVERCRDVGAFERFGVDGGGCGHREGLRAEQAQAPNLRVQSTA